MLVLFSALLVQALPAFTADRVSSPLSALTFRMAGDDLRMRVVVMFDREPKLSTLLLDNPHRLVVDLPETRFGFDEDSLAARGLVSRVRYGLVGKGRSRLILTLRGPSRSKISAFSKMKAHRGTGSWLTSLLRRTGNLPSN